MRHYRFDAFSLDTSRRELRQGDGSPIPLTGKAFDTLCVLIDNRDRIVSKDELLGTVWAGRVVEENNLNQAIAALRRALGTNAGEHRYILTVPGRGYRFVAELRSDPPVAPGPETTPPPAAWRRPAALVALSLALVLLAVLLWRWQALPLADQPVSRSLAVLPFRPLGSGSDDELMELGLAETLISRISGSNDISVRPLASSQRIALETQTALDAGRKLDVSHVVEGTIQRQGERIRVSARLLAVSDGSALWSGTFDEDVDRVFTLQDRIAAALASALSVKIGVVLDRSPCEGSNAAAYRAYLGGYYQLGRPSAERMQLALESFQQAIDLDPSCAKAYAGMGYAYRSLVMTGDRDPREHLPLAKAATERALEISPALAEAHASQGFLRFWYDWDWDGAEASFQHAIELNPSLADARLAYAHLLSNIGRHEEAVAQGRRAVELDPLSPLTRALVSSYVDRAGLDEEADRMHAALLEMAPDFFVALLVRSHRQLESGDAAGAVAGLIRARELCGDCSQILSPLGAAYVRAGDRDAAEEILHELERRRAAGYLPATSVARVHHALGHTAEALDLLEQGYEERDVRMAFLRIDFPELRGEPRFDALMARMAFPEPGAPPSGSAAAPDQK